MNPRIAKEIRTQAPVLGLLFACATATVSVQRAQAPYAFFDVGPILLGIYFISCLLMAAMAFGNEFHLRTMSLLLSQPIARRKLWPEKMRVLAAFNVASFLIVFQALMVIPAPWANNYHNDSVELGCIMIFAPVLFSAMTPYFTMVSRSTVGGVVFTLFTAGMLLTPCDLIWRPLAAAGFGPIKDQLTFGLLDGPSFVYVMLSLPVAALFYWLGRRKFLRMEIIDSQALEASLPAALENPLAKFSAQFNGAFSKLLFKELHLQRISLLLTAALCLFMAVEWLTWKPDSNHSFFVAGILIIYVGLFPVIVGASAVAEEKTWGMKDWHLTLPPSLGRQWRIKWLMALVLTLVLGAGPAIAFARLGPWHKELDFEFTPEWLCYPLLVAIALYAASISTSTIRAFLLTFGILVAFFSTIGLLGGLIVVGLATYAPTTLVAGVIAYMLADIYTQALWLLWNLIVCPVWWCTHSRTATAAVAQWAEPSLNNHHLKILLLIITICACFWLILRFAKSNYRHSDVAKRRIFRQCLILFVAALFLALTVLGLNTYINSSDLPHWTWLPDISSAQ